MLIIGSGPIGSELGQSFARLGTNVTMFERGSQYLPRDDPDVVKILQEQMEKDGVHINFNTIPIEFHKIPMAEGDDFEKVKVVYDKEGKIGEKEFDVVMVAAGRIPNVEGLDCEKAGVDYSPQGITVDNHLATSNKNIFAVGDCIPGYKFTHNSDIHARYVIRNALFFGKMDYT
mmetsp:Transcript_5053/g.8616  ORF Transcript_5053/g.8616 Transcript_5053/m.8616 type:complete len:174 (+) Transcript_5053:1061-1582(+)